MERTMKFKLKVVTIVLSVVVVPVSAQFAGKSGPKDVMDRFCKIDFDGKLMISEGEEEAARFLVSPYMRSPDRTIVVVNDYVVRGPDMLGNRVHFTVDYHVWGEVDSSLRFTREEGGILGEPIKNREYYDLVFTNRHNQPGDNGPKAVVKGPLAWRIEVAPSRPHASVDAAIRYVTEMRDKASDHAIKENADRTITALAGIRSAAQRPANVGDTPAKVVEQFCRMDSEGKQLTSSGWGEMNALLAQPRSPHWEKIIVVEHFAVSNASISDEKRAAVVVEYVTLGQLDSSAALLQSESILRAKELVNFNLILTNALALPGPDKNSMGEAKMVAWKIEGSPPEPHITVDTAIRYITEMRDKATDFAIKKNADQTLAKLKNLHR